MLRCKNCVVGLLGVCSEDYCLPEREWPTAEARRSAEEHGHTLTEFIKVEDHPIWQARCARCGRLAAVNLDPLPGEPDIYGEALTVNCPEIDGLHDRPEDIEREPTGGPGELLWIERLKGATRDEAD
jgi:hypothetical protein